MIEDSLGDHIYKSIKGSFTWGRHLKPQYFWFNGTADHYLLGDKVPEGDTVVVLNQIHGSYSDVRSKIYPMRIHTTKQPFDLGTRMIIQPKLAALKKGVGAYWKDFDWNKAAEVGMKHVGLPYSGKFGWINTIMYWPLNHMVSTKDKSLQCTDCHTENNSRLAGLTDFYMPARDHYSIVDTLGKLLIILTLLGVIGHGSIRYYFNKKNKS